MNATGRQNDFVLRRQSKWDADVNMKHPDLAAWKVAGQHPFTGQPCQARLAPSGLDLG